MSEPALIKKQRPKNLDLMTIRLPLPGIVSIIHRISGAGLFLMLPLLLWLFQSSVESSASFDVYSAFFANPLAKLLLLALLAGYLYHAISGVRFLLLDLHIGIEIESSRLSSKLVLISAIALTAIIGGLLLW